MCGSSTREPQYGSSTHTSRAQTLNPIERDLCIDNLLVRIHVINVMNRRTGPAPWEVEFALLGVPAGVRAARAARQGAGPHAIPRILVYLVIYDPTSYTSTLGDICLWFAY